MAEHGKGNNLFASKKEQITSNHGCFREYQTEATERREHDVLSIYGNNVNTSASLHVYFSISVLGLEPGDLAYAKHMLCH